MSGALDPCVAWIREQQPVLDEVLAKAGAACWEATRTRPNAAYDFEVANLESYRLSRGLDLCYDRPTTGLVYGLWYHARRVNTSLGLVLDALSTASGEEIDVYDLGAGTGAFQWAFALSRAALVACGQAPPAAVRFINVDTSPPMLHYLGHLWEHLVRRIPECWAVTYECSLNTWHRGRPPAANTWLCASYLFDHEDKKEDLSRDFDTLVSQIDPQRVLLSTSGGKARAGFLRSIGEQLQTRNYAKSGVAGAHYLSGDLNAVNDLRRRLQRSVPVPSLRPN